MATRWSHAHGESHLRRKWSGGGVEDVERLTMVLWFRGIGQWRSALVELARWRHSMLVAVHAEEGDGSENGECVGQVRGVLKTRLSVPGRPRRVACALRRAATGGATRPTTSEPVGHNTTEPFQKKHDSMILTMTDRAGLTMISS